jgi:class 3 adenylate cyclase
MGTLPEDPRLAEVVKQLEGPRWAAFLVDCNWRIVWVADELKAFLGESDETKLGYGLHVAEALLSDTWSGTISDESKVRMFMNAFPYVISQTSSDGLEEMLGRLPEPMRALLEALDPQDAPPLWAERFTYIEPGSDLSPYDVDLVAFGLNSGDEFIGICFLTFMHIRPNLLSLLARGDEPMYERMAHLVDPGKRQAAIFFADLQGSGALSRKLPSATYFRLMRELTTQFDAAVAEHLGIVGKHAGDGMTAFFLVEDLGSASEAACAAIATARQVQATTEKIFAEMTGELGAAAEVDCVMNVGLHWGGSLYMGQLVPGGRLDVTALGDEVNECARIQESASDGELFASKSLLEQLDLDGARRLGLDPERFIYRPLAEVQGVTEKTLRDAGGIAVTVLDERDPSLS